MKTTSNLLDPGSSLHDEAPWQTEGLDQTPVSSYARDLRVVGQLLERRQITNARLVCVADAYIIRGIQRLTGDSRIGRSFLPAFDKAIRRCAAWGFFSIVGFGNC